jgi:hypothetical protein
MPSAHCRPLVPEAATGATEPLRPQRPQEAHFCCRRPVQLRRQLAREGSRPLGVEKGQRHLLRSQLRLELSPRPPPRHRHPASAHVQHRLRHLHHPVPALRQNLQLPSSGNLSPKTFPAGLRPRLGSRQRHLHLSGNRPHPRKSAPAGQVEAVKGQHLLHVGSADLKIELACQAGSPLQLAGALDATPCSLEVNCFQGQGLIRKAEAKGILRHRQAIHPPRRKPPQLSPDLRPIQGAGDRYGSPHHPLHRHRQASHGKRLLDLLQAGRRYFRLQTKPLSLLPDHRAF